VKDKLEFVYFTKQRNSPKPPAGGDHELHPQQVLFDCRNSHTFLQLQRASPMALCRSHQCLKTLGQPIWRWGFCMSTGWTFQSITGMEKAPRNYTLNITTTETNLLASFSSTAPSLLTSSYYRTSFTTLFFMLEYNKKNIEVIEKSRPEVHLKWIESYLRAEIFKALLGR